MQNGGGTPEVSDQVTVTSSGSGATTIQYDFGFFTTEVVTPNTFLDSLTVSIQDAALDVTVVSTTDASGTLWEPPSPGAVPLTASAVGFQTMAPTQLSPVNGRGVAYAVDVTLPAGLQGTTFTVDFDLFDDQNPSTFALAYFGNVEVVSSVPEPSAEILVCLGGLIVGLIKKFKSS
jgi:hypothetical protein